MRLAQKWFCIVVLSAILCEGVVRLWGIWPRYVLQGKGLPSGSDSLIFELDTELLYRIVPSTKLHINSDGFRDREFAREKAKRRIVVIGDSFPMGLAVNPEETFPKVLETMLGDSEVYNLGIQGYGPDQAVLALESHALALQPDLVIASFYPSNDYHDLVKNRLFDVIDGKLVPHHPNPVEQVIPSLRLAMALRLIVTGRFLDPNVETALDQLLFQDANYEERTNEIDRKRAEQEMRLLLRRLRSQPVPVMGAVIPSYQEIQGDRYADAAFLLEKGLVSACEEEGFQVLDLTGPFIQRREEGLYLDTDRHLSKAGHRLVAELLASRPILTK